LNRIKVMLAALAAGVVLTAVAASTAGAATPTLTGTVGPGFTITLTSGGRPVKTLKAGTYNVSVSDKSNIHNFHLKGPGLDKQITTVPFQGSKSVSVTLKKGTYTYVCDPHATIMKGSFTVS
jgi:plastocyanin